ncbi:unnamed protein product (macronuclear) [Paramecium tetraurelia]|uniref:YTH domain-containing protein n=1 Tax=Paramecium tetraurelia TaxID=5888 RepID=A0D4C9_PARTE|nr:uncharacterized protein GSPATT00013362001 [Paramecium tetraurelia]CAK77896.1 unnamed protein product [Paramecium tetraurelia]|eukprot:XP_001445293.1 hypothetical protein (macronuclear) [Paramecium tetraurelia strain d4-2]
MQTNPNCPQPEAQYLDNYENFEEVTKTFKCLQNVHQPLEPEATYFLIRAPTKDNVHRAIKYGIWTRQICKKFLSSSRNNQKLNDASRPLYLLFNVTQTSHFIGMAKIVSNFRETKHFMYWAEENKWFGSFQIEWVFVRDLPYNELSSIQQSDGKCIHELIDCTQIENGDLIYSAFEKQPQKSCMLKSFKELDNSEKRKRNERDSNSNFAIQFQEYISVFETMPFTFSVASYQRRKQQQFQNQYYQQCAYYYQSPWSGVAQPSFWNQQQLQQQPLQIQQQQQQQQQQSQQSLNNPGFYQTSNYNRPQAQNQQNNKQPKKLLNHKNNNQQSPKKQ